MKNIPLGNNKFTLVDDEWYPILYLVNWSLLGRGYAINNKLVKMHRFIMNAPRGVMIDHINGDKLDNRRENLRFATDSQNKANKGTRIDNTSGFKGVYYGKDKNRIKRWCAELRLHRKKIYLGRYLTKEEAALAYNKGAKKYFGEFAKLNKI